MPANSGFSNGVTANSQMTKLAKSYQADQQLKYLHLQAEVEVLLQQLQSLKQKRSEAELVAQGNRE
ncbi:hypothetical protein [Lusitaniella coriacea]